MISGLLAHSASASRLTQGIRGPQKIDETAGHLAQASRDTLAGCSTATRVQLAADLKKVMLALGNREQQASVPAQQRLSQQTAMLAAGSLLATGSGLLVSRLAADLHEVTGCPARLREFSEQVRALPAQTAAESPLAGATFKSLATNLLAKGANPVTLCLSGAFLSVQQRSAGLQEETLRQ